MSSHVSCYHISSHIMCSESSSLCSVIILMYWLICSLHVGTAGLKETKNKRKDKKVTKKNDEENMEDAPEHGQGKSAYLIFS